MDQLIFDSTWSFRIKTTVYLKQRETPVIYYPATMKQYSDVAVKEAYKATADTIRRGITHNDGGVFMLGPNIVRAGEVQSCQVRVELINELKRGQKENLPNDYAQILTDTLAQWYAELLNNSDN